MPSEAPEPRPEISDEERRLVEQLESFTAKARAGNLSPGVVALLRSMLVWFEGVEGMLPEEALEHLFHKVEEQQREESGRLKASNRPRARGASEGG